ncbi:hypothetical protein [Rhizorhapis suberifaciens]|uniref:Uncharacterized protein n=1 Tax=Rhizorhapis suberifaciens TaxID=13656 RepID=A0A840HV27_9SPHN|nr:hypothetical protein [Rhizorhapis suberifaciens]MBB4642142.1 hypothetical protein [Rhizorhapis suberifaciens]
MKHDGDISAAADAAADHLAVMNAIAAELEAARHSMEQLGLALCLDPHLAQAHLPALQSLDELGQRQTCLAQILRSSDMAGAVKQIPLDALRDRMMGHLAKYGLG